jgi:hypothetical protein
MKLYVPESMVRVNSCVLQIEFEPFRAYERGVASVNQSVQTTSSTKKEVSTSSSTSAQTPTTSTAASQTPTTSYESTTYPTTTTTQTQSETTDSSPSQTPTTSTADRQYSSTDSGGASTATSDSVSLLPENMRDLSGYYNGAKHNHGIPEGTQFITAVNFEGKSFTSIGFAASGAHVHGEHSHSVSIPGHKHSVDIPGHSHNVSIPGHSHNFQIPGHGHSITINGHSHDVRIDGHSHSVTIPGHNHSVDIPAHDHTVTVPAHTHTMEYGIFKGGSVSSGKLYVNGKYIMDVSPNTNIDLANLLADPKTKKISRNVFHRIEVYPIAASANPKGLTRIVANIFMQIFTNSRGKGDY